MRLMLIGCAVGALAVALIFHVSDDGSGAAYGAARGREVQEAGTRAPPAPDDGEVERLRALVEQLRAQLSARGEAPELDLAAAELPDTEEAIDQLLEEFQQTDDLDRLLVLVHALLHQGERGFPKLTKVLMRVAGKAMANRFQEEQLLQRLIPALRLAMHHEKELVGYVGYLLTAEDTPKLLRTGATGAAMFLSVNGVKGSEVFAPQLLAQFLERSDGPGAAWGGDEARILIEAMGFLKQKSAVDPLLRMLKDPQQAEAHSRVVQALGRIGDPRAVGPLVQRLRTTDPKNSWWSPELQALAEIGSDEATAAAREYLTGIEDDNRFFNQVGGYLRRNADEKVIGMVRDRFRSNPGSSNLWSVIYGLRQAGTPAAYTVLEEMAANAATQEHIRRQVQGVLDQREKLEESLER